MRILNLTLCDYKRLRVSNIKEIEIDTSENNIQLIIGSNGSGKSSIMHEFFPFPPIKSSFGKTGFKALSLQHNNKLYNLTYDYSDGHAFFCDGINLNISGTNEIQKELIREHFGITGEIHTILKGALPICEMVPSQRKKVLMNMNPIDVSLFIDKYQKVHKDVIAYGNNLDRLYTRQKQLIEQKIPEEQFKKMLDHKNLLENQEKILLMWMTSVSAELEKYPLTGSCTYDIDELSNTVRMLYKQLPKFKGISRASYKKDLLVCSSRSEVLLSELKEIERVIEETVRSLNEYESKKQSLQNDNTNVEKELSELLLRLKEFHFDEGFYGIPEEYLQKTIHDVECVKNIILELTYTEYTTILSKEELNDLYKRNVESHAIQVNRITMIRDIEKRIDELKKTITTYKLGINCEREKCELLQTYLKNVNTKQIEIDELTTRLTQYKAEIERISNDHEKNITLYETQSKIWKYIDEVFRIIHMTQHLNRNFSDQYILEKIRESPMLIIHEFLDYIRLSETFIEYQKLSKKAKELEVVNASLASKKLLSMEVLDTEINRYINQLQLMRNRHETKSNQLNTLNEKHVLLQSFDEIKENVHQFDKKIQEIEQCIKNKASREYIHKLYTVMNTLLTDIRKELSDITTLTRDQEMLLVRLDKEVDSVIAEMKPRYDKTKIIERSLYELPIKYTKTFVNNIIETTNYFINEIMTYPFQLVPVDENDECDFTFPVMIDNSILIKDINLCSDGQKAIIQFAFNLAMVIELRFNEFPIYSDEVDRTLDTTHGKRLTEVLADLVNRNIVTQLFVVGHHAAMLDKFTGFGDIVVLNSDNIVLPEVYNTNVKIVQY